MFHIWDVPIYVIYVYIYVYTYRYINIYVYIYIYIYRYINIYLYTYMIIYVDICSISEHAKESSGLPSGRPIRGPAKLEPLACRTKIPRDCHGMYTVCT